MSRGLGDVYKRQIWRAASSPTVSRRCAASCSRASCSAWPRASTAAITRPSSGCDRVTHGGGPVIRSSLSFVCGSSVPPLAALSLLSFFGFSKNGSPQPPGAEGCSFLSRSPLAAGVATKAVSAGESPQLEGPPFSGWARTSRSPAKSPAADTENPRLSDARSRGMARPGASPGRSGRDQNL